MILNRRLFLAATAAAAIPGSLLSRAPRAQPGRAKVIRFVPLGDVGIRDPHRVSLKVTAHHSYLIYDTLYGIDDALNVQPQMAEGHTVSPDWLTWSIVLREHLVFHDGTPVLARDAVASIRRWALSDPLGALLMASTDELSAPDDRTIRFRLKTPFPLLLLALGKTQPPMLAIMPERLAKTRITANVPEAIGSGPFRFNTGEFVVGSQLVYDKNTAYVPRPSGKTELTAGPKIVLVDRVEWHVIPDASTAMSALSTGEMDWWERPTFDFIPSIAANKSLRLYKNDPLGEVGSLILNKSQPPFDNPALCRAMFDVIDQTEMMQGVAGADASYWRSGVGCFAPGSPWAATAGLESLHSPVDYEQAKRAVKASGYNGEKIALMVASDIPDILSASQIGESQFRKAGLNVEFQASDLGSVIQRRLSHKPVSEGGWSCYFIPIPGSYLYNPVLTTQFRGSGQVPGNGYTNSPALDAILARWVTLDNDPARMALAEQLQRQCRIDVPYVTTGNYIVPTAFRDTIRGVPGGGLVRFWGVDKIG